MHKTYSDQFINVPGGNIFVRRWKQGAGTPIILLHDSLGSVELWRGFPEALAAALGREVIAYDRLGFGKSSPRSDKLTINFIREEGEIYFKALKEALGIKNFALFGHSVGGGMAVVIASIYRDECEGVISESAQAFIEPFTLEGIRKAKKQFENPNYFAKLEKLHGTKAKWVLDAWTESWLAPEFSDWTLDEHLKLVKCPILAIHGEYDEFGSYEFPKRIVKLAGGHAEQALISKCGHVPHREKKEEIIKLTAGFLGRDKK